MADVMTLSCRDAEALLAREVAGAADESLYPALQRHCLSCAACRELALRALERIERAEGSPHAFPEGASAAYDVGVELAAGGMGKVLVAQDRRLERPIAMKQLLVNDPDLEERFRREALITARLQHPAIVPIYDAGRLPTGELFYTMRLLAGVSLADALAKAGGLAARLAFLPNVLAAADALAYAHSHRVVHRDLKPANILIGEFGETIVIDWGLAKDLAADAREPVGVDRIAAARRSGRRWRARSWGRPPTCRPSRPAESRSTSAATSTRSAPSSTISSPARPPTWPGAARRRPRPSKWWPA